MFESDDDTVAENSAMSQWGKIFAEGGKMLGRPVDVITGEIQRNGIEDAGFVVLGQKDLKVRF